MPSTVFVAPADQSDQHNTLRSELQPIALWELVDAHFAFDSSVLLPTMTEDLAELIGILQANPGALASVFGHADTTGNDDYNKTLSGRRAMALFALLTRRVDMWEQLFREPHGGDNWRRDQDFALALMRDTVGDDTKVFARPVLFGQYMGALSKRPDGNPFVLPQTAFLGNGSDAKGKAAFQGCSEFNPLIMFSAAQTKDFQSPSRKDARDTAGEANRRVVVYLFPPTTIVDPAKWPCPRALEGTAGCRKRFWSDAALRRTPQALERRVPVDIDTFACRFYQRLASETARESPVKHFVEVEVHDERGVLLPGERMILRRADGLVVPATADANGIARFNRIPEGKVEVGFASASHFPEPKVSERDGTVVAATPAGTTTTSSAIVGAPTSAPVSVPPTTLPSPFTDPLAPPKARLPSETPDPAAAAREEGSDKPALDASVVARGKTTL